MFERILVPLDGSALAEAVLTPLAPLARRTGALLLPLRVYRADVSSRMDSSALTLDRRQEAEAYIARMEDYLAADGLESRGLVRFGDAAETILDTAEEENASLIALSTHGRSGLSRWVYGSVAEKVLRASRRPVLVVRSFVAASATPVTKPFGTILLPTDGSACAESVVPAVAALARRFGSRVVVLRVLEEDGERETAADAVQSVTARLAAEGVDGVVALKRGDPAGQILDACPTYDVDLLAMGTHGRTGPSRWIFGSVTEKVLRAAPIPLLVVRGAGAAAPGRPVQEAAREA
jgi:nucleotide-binding universal stress UspA family protein